MIESADKPFVILRCGFRGKRSSRSSPNFFVGIGCKVRLGRIARRSAVCTTSFSGDIILSRE